MPQVSLHNKNTYNIFSLTRPGGCKFIKSLFKLPPTLMGLGFLMTINHKDVGEFSHFNLVYGDEQCGGNWSKPKKIYDIYITFELH